VEKRNHGKEKMSVARDAPHFRTALAADIPELHRLIERSVRELQANDYSPEQLEGALGTYLGVDTQLIADGTYLAVEAEDSDGRKLVVACGGWSRRRTLFGADRRPGRDDSLLNPKSDAAKIRAFFVHPDWARQGIGSRILELCEEAARAEGFTRFEMGATLTGVPLYRRWGYAELERIELPLANGLSLPIVRMEKRDQGRVCG
jgi:GNAT superfamily N-acetyltransferase